MKSSNFRPTLSPEIILIAPICFSQMCCGTVANVITAWINVKDLLFFFSNERSSTFMYKALWVVTSPGGSCRTHTYISFWVTIHRKSDMKYKMTHNKKSLHSLTNSVQCFFVFHMSTMPFHIFHTFSLHYAQSALMSVLCMDKSGSKAFKIILKGFHLLPYHYMKLNQPCLVLSPHDSFIEKRL